MNSRSIPSSSGHGLPALEARLQRELDLLCLPARHWVPPRSVSGQPVIEVAIIGGGMAGLTLSAALTHLGIPAPMCDRAPAGLEGPWATTARMETLRSPKELTGPALGLSRLTFRAWFEAQFGAEGGTLRVSQHTNAHFHFGVPVLAVGISMHTLHLLFLGVGHEGRRATIAQCVNQTLSRLRPTAAAASSPRALRCPC